MNKFSLVDDLSLGVPLAHLLEHIFVMVLLGFSEDPRVFEEVVGAHALGGIDHEQGLDDVDGLGRDGVPRGRGEVVLALLDLVEQHEVVVVVERREPTQPNTHHNHHYLTICRAPRRCSSSRILFHMVSVQESLELRILGYHM